jgi:predicted Zn-dependent protease
MKRFLAILHALQATLCLFAGPAQAFTIQLDAGKEILGWASSEITFDVNYADCVARGVSQDRLNTAIDTALSAWNNTLTSSVQLRRGGSVTTTSAQILAQTTAGNPLILCNASLKADLTASEGKTVETDSIPAVTQVLRVDGERHIALAVVHINAESGKAAQVANIIGLSNLLEVVLAHEVGHAVGLGHSSDVNALMYFDASSKTELGLARDDVDGITYLYPRSELWGGNGLFGCGTVAKPRAGGAGPDDAGGWPGAASLSFMIGLCWFYVFLNKRRARLLSQAVGVTI